MAARDHRPKASEIFRATQYVFSRKAPFVEAFPEIDRLLVEVEEDGYGVIKSPYLSGKSRYTEKTCGEYINCSNRFCYNGGFSIGSILRDMVREHKEDHEDWKICQGYEGSPKGRRHYRSCINNFKIKVHITYKSADRAP
jgi:hypothetical protein